MDEEDSSDLLIRRARRGDAEQVYWIHVRSLVGVDRSTMDWFGELFSLRSRRLKAFVAEERGEILGFIVAYKNGSRAYVDYLAVDPKARGRGIGTSLLETVERELAEEGVESISLSVKGDNNKALQFYVNRGYIINGVVLILSSPVKSGGDLGDYSANILKGGLGALGSKIMHAAWWSSVTEHVDRRVLRRLEDELTLVLRKGSRIRGVAEFSPKKRMKIEYLGVSYHKPAEALEKLILAIWREAEPMGVEETIVPADGSKGSLIKTLIDMGFTVRGSEYRLYKELDV